MAVDRETLIRRLETICTSACAGDTEAVAKVNQIKEAAAAGDARAKLALAALRHLYWTKQEDTASWEAAEAVYRQTVRGNPKAKLVVKEIIARAKAGDSTAIGTWGRMKALHGSTQPGALFPAGAGQAKVGGYGLPVRNRAGVVVGGRGKGLGLPARNYANRLVGGPSLVGGMGLPNYNQARRLIGGFGLPVRGRSGIVIGVTPSAHKLTPAEIVELKDLMERAARARILRERIEGQFTTSVRAAPTLTQRAQRETIYSRAFADVPVQVDTSLKYTRLAPEGTDLRGSI